jgi:hypothetical protein
MSMGEIGFVCTDDLAVAVAVAAAAVPVAAGLGRCLTLDDGSTTDVNGGIAHHVSVIRTAILPPVKRVSLFELTTMYEIVFVGVVALCVSTNTTALNAVVVRVVQSSRHTHNNQSSGNRTILFRGSSRLYRQLECFEYTGSPSLA